MPKKLSYHKLVNYSIADPAKVLAGDQAATKRYLTFLGSGGSDYPIDLLKKAGVDMTTDEPLDLTIKKSHDVLKEQCEDFLFGSGGQLPAQYVPVGDKKD